MHPTRLAPTNTMPQNSKKTVSIIVASAQNNVIGKDNALLWRLSDDLRNFKRLTSNHAVIMGRKTYDSIGKPLPNRLNIVVTRSKNLQIEGCRMALSLEEALEIAQKEDDNCNEIFIIGGETIYRQALPLADVVYFTEVFTTLEGDAFFPELGSEWKEQTRTHFKANEKNEYDFDVVIYKK